jgi:hypothetical protein
MGHPADINAMNLLHSGRGAATAGEDSSKIMVIPMILVYTD